MTIAAILPAKGSEVLTVECDTSVRDAVALLAERKIGAVPVRRAAAASPASCRSATSSIA